MGDQLQWGHDFSVVDILDDPLSFPLEIQLQWGHDFSVVDILHPLPKFPEPADASMGPRLFSRGYPARWLAEMRWTNFNGATTFQSWISLIANRIRRSRSCFNGATTFQSWISAEPGQARNADVPLQWGHDFSVVDICRV